MDKSRVISFGEQAVGAKAADREGRGVTVADAIVVVAGEPAEAAQAYRDDDDYPCGEGAGEVPLEAVLNVCVFVVAADEIVSQIVPVSHHAAHIQRIGRPEPPGYARTKQVAPIR